MTHTRRWRASATPANGLRPAEQLLTTLLEVVPEATVVTDGAGKVVVWTEEAERVFGWAAAEACGRSPLFLHVDGNEDYHAAQTRALRGERTPAVMVQGRRKDGSTIDLTASAGPVHDEDGRAVGTLALFRQDSLHRSLIDRLPIVAFVYDIAADSPVFVSPQIEQLVGFTAAEWASDRRLWLERVHPEDLDAVRQAVADLHATGDPSSCDYRLIARDGRVVWVHGEATVQRDDSGRAVRTHGYLLDITERKLAERELSDSEERYRQLFANALDACATLDLEGRITAVSVAGERLFGRPAEELLGTCAFDLLAPDHSQLAQRQFERKLTGDPARTTYEIEVLRADGQRVPLEITSRSILADGVPVGVLGVARDLTAERRLEDALGAPGRWHRAFVETLPAITYLATITDGVRAIYVSPQIRMLGYTPEEWTAQPGLWASLMHPDDRDRAVGELERTVATGMPFQSEYRMLTRDGRTLWWHDHAVITGSGSERLLLGTALDITAEKLSAPARVDAQHLAEEVARFLEAKGIPSGTWIVDVEQTRRALQDADDLLRRMADAMVRASGPVLLARPPDLGGPSSPGGS